MTTPERRLELLEVEAASRRVSSSAAGSTPQTGSLTVTTGTYVVVGVRKQATGTQRITVLGTGRLRIQN
jgi:hypothetical protein